MADLEDRVLAEVRRILATDLEIARAVELDDELAADLEVDSLGAVVLAVGLEDRFRVRLSDSDAATVVTVGDLVDTIARRVRDGASDPRSDETTP